MPPHEVSSHSTSIRRAPRSKSGCLTCRRRKVRCNEQKPRCSHCERLNLQCSWRSSSHAPQSPRPASESLNVGEGGVSVGSNNSGVQALEFQGSRHAPVDGQFSDIFNYANFMWDQDLQSGIIQPSRWRDMGLQDMDVGAQRFEIDDLGSIDTSSFLSNRRRSNQLDLSSRDIIPGIAALSSPDYSEDSVMMLEAQYSSEERILRDYFIRTVVPPILAQVETQLKWSSMRQLLIAMSKNSIMVHHAILAFSGLLMARNCNNQNRTYERHYQNARTELTRQRNEPFGKGEDTTTPALEDMLATLFFLSYIDLLEGRIVDAQTNLKEAYDIFQGVDKSQLRTVNKRLISWLRLLDARAVSAGGEGLFLLEDEDLLAHSTSASTDITDGGGVGNDVEADIEDVLFDSLYQPGFFFFQRIQSFMGRISKIDPWHRSRGTVADETEVMSIAAKISRDLGALWDTRPPLMDYALNGKLTSAHISPSLVFTITRTFRTYFANYNASRIHLHRVAYKHLPLSVETEESIASIRNTARVMAEAGAASAGSEPEMFPVNMLWPLLMWGCEENDLQAREWILVQIQNMEKVATNAKITAQVLSEVQVRQDKLGKRVDVRTVMHDIFNSCFAIV